MDRATSGQRAGEDRCPECGASVRGGRAGCQAPDPIGDRGPITMADVEAASGADEHALLVQQWARVVWSAYPTRQAQAREWIEAALQAAATPVRRRSAGER